MAIWNVMLDVIWVVLQWGCYTAFWLWWDSMPLLSVSAYYHSWQSMRFLSCSCISVIHHFDLNSLPLITITWNIGLIAILQCLSRPFPHFCDFILHTPLITTTPPNHTHTHTKVTNKLGCGALKQAEFPGCMSAD